MINSKDVTPNNDIDLVDLCRMTKRNMYQCICIHLKLLTK